MAKQNEIKLNGVRVNGVNAANGVMTNGHKANGHHLKPKKLEKIDEDWNEAEEPPYFVAVSTFFIIIMLGVIGRIRDFLRYWNIEKNKTASPSDRTKHFVPLYSDYESFYNRNLLRRGVDVCNRPVCSTPGAEMDLVNRYSDNYNWTFKHNFDESRRVLNFGSYNYLGFAESKGICHDRVKESIDHYGISICSSRQEVGTVDKMIELEKLVAEFTRQDAAIIFPMGFATNALNLPILGDKNTCIISDVLNHTSLILGIRMSGAHIKRFKHNDIKDLEKEIRRAIVQGHPRTRRPFNKLLVVVEGIYSMEGTILRLDEIIELKKKYQFHLYVDEAHSIGALGPNGGGVMDYYPNIDSKQVDIAMGTLTKSFASAGGYIAGTKRMIEFLREKSHASIYGMAMPIPVCVQITTSMKIIMGRVGGTEGTERLQKLAWNTRYFRSQLHKKGLIVYGNKDSPVIPIIICRPSTCMAISRECLRRGVGVVIVAFPATSIILARIRFCMSASHTKEMLDKTLNIIEDVVNQTSVRYSRLKVPEWCNNPFDS